MTRQRHRHRAGQPNVVLALPCSFQKQSETVIAIERAVHTVFVLRLRTRLSDPTFRRSRRGPEPGCKLGYRPLAYLGFGSLTVTTAWSWERVVQCGLVGNEEEHLLALSFCTRVSAPSTKDSFSLFGRLCRSPSDPCPCLTTGTVPPLEKYANFQQKKVQPAVRPCSYSMYGRLIRSPNGTFDPAQTVRAITRCQLYSI